MSLPTPSGVLLLDKPAGWTSNAALGRVRRLLGGIKAGHTGTLDPFASGLLPITVGEAGKFSRYLLDSEKRYLATLRLGFTSSTGDPEGVVQPVASTAGITVERIQEVLKQFLGPQTQIPPMHSALKQNGVPLYKLARQGVEVERQPRNIRLDHLALIKWDGAENLIIDVTCSKGTYVRVLGEDIGRALGVGAYLTGLRRTGAGIFSIDDAIDMAGFESLEPAARHARLLPGAVLASSLPKVYLDQRSARDLLDGKHPRISAMSLSGEVQAWGPGDVFLGVVTAENAADGVHLVPVRLMSPNVLPSFG